ncbi:hypothetical protein BDV98DRAFT_556661 [Pterulicium gracile]|uniref:Enoyl reductase (ER) domain-containing protein n=1 Tax=Pterulicium gracile TaxID=1884261 RepID=A0A5C3Q006_9AGAR|nr:hypothetical protein BDV98DRAFT_556661 [Pterula gracilis]
MPSIPKTTKALILQNAAKDEPEYTLGKANSTFALKELELAELSEGQLLVRTIYLSNDPAQRGWIQKDADPERLYVPPIREGEVMRSYVVGQVVQSKSSSIPEGSLVASTGGWREYIVTDDKTARKVDPVPGIPNTVHVGIFGGPGFTAYFGLVSVLDLKKGESIVVSGAAGAVGNIVVQYAKHVLGASKVIGIVGTNDKAEWIKSLGADAVVNYKDADFKEKLIAATEGYVDTYFDNVGGEILDLMLARVKRHGRIAVCGAISSYNGKPTQLNNWFEVISNRLNIHGFLVLDYLSRAPEAVAALRKALEEGKLKHETKGETLVRTKSFEEVPLVWSKLFSGGNIGKLVTQVSDDI